ncbi:SHOCT domain-containing protein [Paenibacillus sp. MMO-177]|uniref:SHOCT domain-containing protein n=1 Tax=Paenibacillus sp. MMO-177 TaxID=3081289 RepID=UPI0030186215
MMMDNMTGNSSMMQMCIIMAIAGIVSILILGLTIFFVIRSLQKGKVKDHPRMILGERYVNGEINQDEYFEKLKWLDK